MHRCQTWSTRACLILPGDGYRFSPTSSETVELLIADVVDGRLKAAPWEE
jgi:hypothetical protein